MKWTTKEIMANIALFISTICLIISSFIYTHLAIKVIKFVPSESDKETKTGFYTIVAVFGLVTMYLNGFSVYVSYLNVSNACLLCELVITTPIAIIIHHVLAVFHQSQDANLNTNVHYMVFVMWVSWVMMLVQYAAIKVKHAFERRHIVTEHTPLFTNDHDYEYDHDTIRH